MASSGTRTWTFSGFRGCGGYDDDNKQCPFDDEVDLEGDDETGTAFWECPVCGYLNEEEL